MSNLNQPRNPAVMILTVVLIVVAIWAVAASAKVARKNEELAQMRADMETLKQTAEQRMMQAQQVADEADKLRRVALKWTLQRQQQLQQEQQRRSVATNVTSSAKSTTAPKPAASKSIAKTSTASRSPVRSSSSRH
jgi:Tfp pilus assembly protein PilO